MLRPLSLLTTVTAVAAAASNCGSQWTVQSFTVDPPAAVGNGQTVTMAATFTIPDGTELIYEGTLRIKATVSSLFTMEIMEPLCNYLECPLTAGTYTWNWTDRFPEGAYGPTQTQLTLSGSVDQKPWLCLRWSAYATGRASNATNAVVTWLYS